MSIESAPTFSDFPTASSGEFAPYDLLLPDMLPYLTVQDLLNWRLLSHETRSPSALIHHVADMGSMERAESVFELADKMTVFRHPTIPNTAAFEGDDAEKQKIFECQLWCMALASKSRTHFARSDVHRIVGKNVVCFGTA
ncbi:unnamed protein product [Symbiodinium sp. CCMP2456]|nr:unnamed protein product [Symbiodinium sp. CCMP2456]